MAALLVMLISHGVAIADGEHKHTNRLIDASSPYLLQHAHNPVNWYSWGSEAFDTAKREDKPIFLSIGYAACHWCHVMERESFENEGIAAVLNEHFISIKVDREERPDLDEVYMAAVVSMTGRGGWPMSIFMTPDRKPFDGGTYFPPNDRGGRRGLRSLCLEIASKWSTDRDSLMQEAGSLARKVNRNKQVRGGSILVDPRTISRNVERLAGSFDSVLGGRRSSRNKFPPTMAMELMLREYASQTEISKPRLVDLVETTLTQMARGGIYDHIGGGICRYSTDPRWFAPHFEKMLYDQGTVSGVYLSAYQLTENDDYARVARGILDYCISDLQSAAGGFFSSRDADSEGEEGKFYVWRRDEIESHLSAEDAKLFCDYYNVTRRGNWHHGQNILHVKTSDEAFATKHNLDIAGWRGRLGAMQDVLRQVRSQRVEPGLDDKILTEWNGLIITSLARAYRILDEPRYRVAASSAMEFILTEMMREGRLYRAHRHGKTHIAACAADYSNIIEALITLYETTFDRKWLGHAEKLNDAFIQYYWDAENGGFFYTAHDAEKLIVRSKNLRDGVVPSANSTAILNFLRLAVLTGRTDLRDRAADTIRVLQPYIARGALERAQWAALFYHNHPREIAIVGDPADAATQALVAEVYHRYLPGKVVAVATPEQARSPEALPLLRRKTLLKGKPAAYVCRNYLCGRPVSTPADLSRQLDASSP